MRTYLLLVLAFVMVTESKVHDVKKLLLMEGIESANEMLRHSSNKTLNQYVKNVMGCSSQYICQIAAALKDTDLSNSRLHRQLYAYAMYTGHFNCTVRSSEEILMRNLLNRTLKCLSRKMSIYKTDNQI